MNYNDTEEKMPSLPFWKKPWLWVALFIISGGLSDAVAQSSGLETAVKVFSLITFIIMVYSIIVTIKFNKDNPSEKAKGKAAIRKEKAKIRKEKELALQKEREDEDREKIEKLADKVLMSTDFLGKRYTDDSLTFTKAAKICLTVAQQSLGGRVNPHKINSKFVFFEMERENVYIVLKEEDGAIIVKPARFKDGAGGAVAGLAIATVSLGAGLATMAASGYADSKAKDKFSVMVQAIDQALTNHHSIV